MTTNRAFFWCLLKKHIPGKDNGAADAASRPFDKDNSLLAISVYGQWESHKEGEILNLKNLDPYFKWIVNETDSVILQICVYDRGRS